MKKRKLKNIPLTRQEWDEIKEYQKITPEQKLDALEHHRDFVFVIWRSNPKIYKTAQKFRKGEL